jgi:hypothetical protein
VPDLDAAFLYAALGRTLCAWETLEAHLSYLYSVFIDRPMEIKALEEYGRDAKTFPARMDGLTSAAEHYFQKNPSQLHERTLADLVKDAKGLLRNRNQIAHGIMYAMTCVSKDSDGVDRFALGYAIVSPWHGTFHIKGDDYFYTSRAIIDYTHDFMTLTERVAELTGTLNPKAKIKVALI